MTDDDFIKAMNLPAAFPQLAQPKDPKDHKEETHEAD